MDGVDRNFIVERGGRLIKSPHHELKKGPIVLNMSSKEQKLPLDSKVWDCTLALFKDTIDGSRKLKQFDLNCKNKEDVNHSVSSSMFCLSDGYQSFIFGLTEKFPEKSELKIMCENLTL